jgi:hypothetical protein
MPTRLLSLPEAEGVVGHRRVAEAEGEALDLGAREAIGLLVEGA